MADIEKDRDEAAVEAKVDSTAEASESIGDGVNRGPGEDESHDQRDEQTDLENSVQANLRSLIMTAGDLLGDLDSDSPVIAAPLTTSASEAVADTSADESVVESATGVAKAPRSRKGKNKKKNVVSEIEWSAETSKLDFIEGEELKTSDEGETISRFEELARRVASTVAQNESAIDFVEAASSDEFVSEESLSPEIESASLTDDSVGLDESTMPSMLGFNEEDTSADLEATALEISDEALPVSTDLRHAGQMEFDALEVDDSAAEPTEFVEADQLISIIESLLFSTDKPVSIATIKAVFKGTNVRSRDIMRALDSLASDYASSVRGVTLEEINGGYQMRTKSDNADFLRRLTKSRPFRLSGPALEVMSIVAYKQPVTKHEIDEIRGVESGHLLRALMERSLVSFAGKAENLPGKPMSYGTTRKFLETFGLRNIKELPTLSEIDELLPEGIGEVEEKETLSDLTDKLSNEFSGGYSEGEDELMKINDQLQQIDTSSEFFEQEKVRERERRDRERAQDIREKLVLDDTVEEKDRRWLDRYEAKLQAVEMAASSGVPVSISEDQIEAAPEIGDQLHALTTESDASTAATQASSGQLDAEDDESEALSESEAAFLDDAGDDDLTGNIDWDDDEQSDKQP